MTEQRVERIDSWLPYRQFQTERTQYRSGGRESNAGRAAGRFRIWVYRCFHLLAS